MLKFFLWLFVLVSICMIGLRAFASEQTIIENTTSGITRCNISTPNAIGYQIFNVAEDFQLSQIRVRVARAGTQTVLYNIAIFNQNFTEEYATQSFDPSGWASGAHNEYFNFDNELIPAGDGHNLVIYPDDVNVGVVQWFRSNSDEIAVNAECTALLTEYHGPGDYNFSILGHPIKFSDAWLIPTTFAATDCTFEQIGATTTASCSDPIITNTTQNVATGLILFFITFFGVLFYFKKERG